MSTPSFVAIPISHSFCCLPFRLLSVVLPSRSQGPLATFYGRRELNNALLPLLITCLNASEWQLRCVLRAWMFAPFIVCVFVLFVCWLVCLLRPHLQPA
jgi:hypothetical protein